jgi:ribosomal protein S18 acetylase RimI-like enzyme
MIRAARNMEGIAPVTTRPQIEALARLAAAIWNEHYVAIIGQAQVDYMLDKFQSPAAIASQLDGGYEYYLASVAGRPAGYIGLVPNEPAGKLLLSKIYVARESRGSGLGARLLEYTLGRAADIGAGSVWLTVNRNNARSIDWYRRRGFGVVKALKADIGNGYFMDDYVLERGVAP